MKYNTKELCEILSYCRHSGSRGEYMFIKKYIDSIPGIRTDKYGNKSVTRGRDVDTIFTSHTDTVHSSRDPIRQKVYVTNGFAHTDHKTILGADDGTGVWLMLNMLYGGVPGVYIFQREEESGGVGSYYSSQRVKKTIKKVISFDRKGYSDIITHQGGKRTCSDKFAKALARAIGGSYKPSSWGTFTDSANYDFDVPECTNVSIGYENGHNTFEKQNLGFAQWLLKRLMTVNFKKLPVDRNPKEITNVWGTKKKGTTWDSWGINTFKESTYKGKKVDFYNTPHGEW